MKKIMFLSLFTASVMLLLPLTVINEGSPAIFTTAIQSSIIKNNSGVTDSTSFRVLNTENDKVTKIKTEDYIFSVVAAEMPALYEDEALKAQAVAAYTFALSRRAENKDKSYDITTDYTIDQSYITEADAKKKWGENAEEYEKKIRNAVKGVSGYVITHNGSPIISVYHAISSGKTEDSENVWGVSLPYLKSVNSVGDKLSEDYKTETEFTLEQLKEKLNEEFEIKDTEDGIFKDISRTASGTVENITVYGKEVTGTRLRSILNLRSSNFEIEEKDGKYKFITYGYGHGVGMSQNGANYMAKQGSDFKEILMHYYTDCKIEKLK